MDWWLQTESDSRWGDTGNVQQTTFTLDAQPQVPSRLDRTTDDWKLLWHDTGNFLFVYDKILKIKFLELKNNFNNYFRNLLITAPIKKLKLIFACSFYWFKYYPLVCKFLLCIFFYLTYKTVNVKFQIN